MINKVPSLSFIIFIVLGVATPLNQKDRYFEELIDYLYENYPDFIPRLLQYNGTKFGKDVSLSNSLAYKNDYVVEFNFTTGYSVYVANAFQHQLKNGQLTSSQDSYNTLYECQAATRYCGGNPAYCRYHEGEKGTRFILVAGHDGPLRPKSIPDRGVGCVFKNGTCLYRHNCENSALGLVKSVERCKVKDEDDVETTDIAIYLKEALTKLTGKRPHLIISRVHRKKLDINREIGMGAFGVDEAERVYNDVHGFIRTAKDSIEGDWGLLLDIHGNNLPEKWTMLGYGVLKYQFDNGVFTSNDSTIQNLADRVDVGIRDLLRGHNSLGHLMEERGISVIPSPINPAPKNNHYLTGGYITKVHGSKSGGKIDALQIEIPVNARKTEEQAHTYLNSLAESIDAFVTMNYDRKGAGLKKGKKNKQNDNS